MPVLYHDIEEVKARTMTAFAPAGVRTAVAASGNLSGRRLEPGLSFILPIHLSKFSLEDFFFPMDPEQLKRNKNQEHQE